MSLPIEAADDLETMARAARAAIDLHLHGRAGDDVGALWSPVAKL